MGAFTAATEKRMSRCKIIFNKTKSISYFSKQALPAAQLLKIRGGRPSTSWECTNENGETVIVSTTLPTYESLAEEVDSQNSSGGPAIVGCEPDEIG